MVTDVSEENVFSVREEILLCLEIFGSLQDTISFSRPAEISYCEIHVSYSRDLVFFPFWSETSVEIYQIYQDLNCSENSLSQSQDFYCGSLGVDVLDHQALLTEILASDSLPGLDCNLCQDCLPSLVPSWDWDCLYPFAWSSNCRAPL